MFHSEDPEDDGNSPQLDPSDIKYLVGLSLIAWAFATSLGLYSYMLIS